MAIQRYLNLNRTKAMAHTDKGMSGKHAGAPSDPNGYRRGDRHRDLSSWLFAGLLLLGLVFSIRALAAEMISTVIAHAPLEISGVAILSNDRGYAVVGDENEKNGRIWPQGSSWKIKPKIKDPESLDVSVSENGDELWLVVGEKKAVIGEPRNKATRAKLGREFRQVCGRGLEGISLRYRDDHWEGVVVWEGGYFDTEKCKDKDEELRRQSPYAKPRLATLRWRKGSGLTQLSPAVELDVPRPRSGRFRATDVAWFGEKVVVLLGSTGKHGGPPYDHTWLQRFDLSGGPVGEPIKLEESWGEFRKRKNWEALDISPDGKRFVMGYDSKKGSTALVLFPNPYAP